MVFEQFGRKNCPVCATSTPRSCFASAAFREFSLRQRGSYCVLVARCPRCSLSQWSPIHVRATFVKITLRPRCVNSTTAVRSRRPPFPYKYKPQCLAGAGSARYFRYLLVVQRSRTALVKLYCINAPRKTPPPPLKKRELYRRPRKSGERKA